MSFKEVKTWTEGKSIFIASHTRRRCCVFRILRSSRRLELVSHVRVFSPAPGLERQTRQQWILPGFAHLQMSSSAFIFERCFARRGSLASRRFSVSTESTSVHPLLAPGAPGADRAVPPCAAQGSLIAFKMFCLHRVGGDVSGPDLCVFILLRWLCPRASTDGFQPPFSPPAPFSPPETQAAHVRLGQTWSRAPHRHGHFLKSFFLCSPNWSISINLQASRFFLVVCHISS